MHYLSGKNDEIGESEQKEMLETAEKCYHVGKELRLLERVDHWGDVSPNQPFSSDSAFTNAPVWIQYDGMKMLLFAALFFVPLNTWAEVDGNGLLKYCESSINAKVGVTPQGELLGIGFCTGMVQGIRETLEEDRRNIICIPKEATSDQLTRVIVKYLKANPEQLHLLSSSLVLAAWLKAYPCEKKIQGSTNH